MATTLTEIANLLRSNYGNIVANGLSQRGIGNENLVKERTLLGWLASQGRVKAGADGASPYGDKAAEWPVHSATASATSYGAADAFGSATSETVGQASLAWKRNHIVLETDNLMRAAAQGNAIIGADAFAFEYFAKLRSLFSAIDDQLAGDGSGNSSKDLDGLQAFMSDSATYGGLAQTGNDYWQATEVAGTGLDLDTDLLDTLLQDMEDRDCGRPSHFLMGGRQLKILRKSKSSSLQYFPQSPQSGELAMAVASYDGIPIVPILTLNSSARAYDEVWAVNVEDITYRYLPQDKREETQVKEKNFMGYPVGIINKNTTGDTEKIVITHYSQLVCTNPRNQGCIIGLNTAI